MRLGHETALWAETLTFNDSSSDMLPPDASVDWKWATEKKYGLFLHDATRCCTSWPHIKWIYNGNMPEMPEGNTSHGRALSLFFFLQHWIMGLNVIFLKTTPAWVAGEWDQSSMFHRAHREKVIVQSDLICTCPLSHTLGQLSRLFIALDPYIDDIMKLILLL